jgi:hypothetical protein
MRRAPIAALVVAAALVAGCGSSGGGTLSHADLVQRADAICARAHAAELKTSTPKTLAGSVAALDAGVAIAVDELRRLRALQPSTEDAKPFKAVLVGLDRSIAATRRARNAIKAGQRLRAQLYIQTALRSVTDTEATATGFGLKVCSKPAS